MAAATLSSATVTATSRDVATLSVSTNQATGTVYAVITASVTTPTHDQIAAGTDDNDDAAIWSSSKAAAATTTFSATDLPHLPGKLYAHFSQTNAGDEDSTPVTATGFKLVPSSYGTLDADGDTDSVTVQKNPVVCAKGDFGSGTLTWKFLGQGGEWFDITDGAMTAAGQLMVAFERPVTIKGTLAGATNPDLDWEVR